MSEKKIVVPEGMLASAYVASVENRGKEFIEPYVLKVISEKSVEAALRWLSEHPIMPTMDQLQDIFNKVDAGNGGTYIPAYLGEWQRTMFLAPAPEVPEAVKNLIANYRLNDEAATCVIDAYHLGQAERKA